MRGGVHRPTYRSWQMMKNRCLNPNAMDFAHYGGRGITVATEWLEYDKFLSDMGERPDTLTLERNNGNLGYSPSNCRWATREEQARNRDYTLDLAYGGRTQKVWEWAAELGIRTTTFHHRRWQFRNGVITEAQAFAPNLKGTDS